VINSSITVTCAFNSNSGRGNEKGGNDEFYIMQDDAGNDGVARQLNTAINNTSGISTSDIEFTAVQDFNINKGGTPADYYGLKMEVKNISIEEVQIKDNSATLNATYGLSLFPFAYVYTGSTVPSCSGIPPILNLGFNDYTSLGKHIQYGGSIF
jgi:hypothetical protein